MTPSDGSGGPAVLVTGGAGYVGSHACLALARAGYAPVVYDDLSAGHADAVRFGPLVVGDVRDTARLVAALRAHGAVAVLHFAAAILAGESVALPGRYYRRNVAGTLSLLSAMREAGVGALVVSSTAAVFGTPAAQPIAETAPLRPINPYGRSKLAMEWAVADHAAAHGLRWAALRYFNAAGADPGGALGERHDPETHAVPLAVLAALGAAPAFSLHGTDYPTPDGTAIRDYVHVSDLAAAHVLALRHLLEGGPSLAMNLGTGAGTSVRELLGAVEAGTGRPVPVREGPRRPGDPPALVADAALARATLGWAPRFAGIGPIVETAVRWHRSQLGAPLAAGPLAAEAVPTAVPV